MDAKLVVWWDASWPFVGGKEPERWAWCGCWVGEGRVAADLVLRVEPADGGGCDSARGFLEGGCGRTDKALRFNGRLEEGCCVAELSRLLDSGCENGDSRTINKPLRVGSAFASTVIKLGSGDVSSCGMRTRTFALVRRVFCLERVEIRIQANHHSPFTHVLL